MAAINAGELDEASRIRLLDHLDECESCAGRATWVSQAVALLREEPIALRHDHLQRVWRNVAAARHAAPATRRTGRGWKIGLAAAGALAAGVLVVLLLRPARPSETTEPTEPASWRAVVLEGARLESAARTPGERAARPGDRVVVDHVGRAVFSSAAEVIVAQQDTELRFATVGGTRQLRLVKGVVAVQTRSSAGSELVVVAGAVEIRPVGTAYAVRWSDASHLEVAVAEGRVRVASPERSVTLGAGQELVWGAAPRPLEAAARRRLEVELAQEPTQVAHLPSASTSRPAAVATPDPASDPPPEIDLQREVRRVERLLAEGHAAQARARAQRLLSRSRGGAHEPSLLTLMAESYVRERRYRDARDAYLQVWRRHPRSALGADGLYMTGSLELEQLLQPASARVRFERYLAAYARGRQRQGAHYLLCLALLQSGETKLARAVAERYLDEFPRGQYRSALERLRPQAPR
jgi:ferric-dicitrate binding protein FerR (iron transport regulator)